MSTPHTIEVTADSVEQAVRKGLAQLGVGPSQVIVEVVEEASRGLFGLGAHPARVRLRVIGVVAPPPATAVVATPPPAPAATPAAPPPIPTLSPLEVLTPIDDDDDDDVIAQDDAPEANILPAGALDFDDDDFFDDDSFDEVIYGKDGAAARPATGAASLSAAPAQAATDSDDIDADAAAALLQDLLRAMGISNASIDVHPSQASSDEAPQWVLNVQADEDALTRLVGRRGDTLHALQHVTRLMVSRTQQRRANLIVDAGSWKVRRAEALRKLAQRMADQAVRTGRTVVMEPMPPNERRIIHITLRKRDDVTTESVGEGEARKITIIPSPARDA